jgi:DNA-3-methyladenine glycosylase II
VTEAEIVRARRHIMRRDPVMRILIKREGPCALAGAPPAEHFPALVRSIVGQQLSVKAAATIYGRVVTLGGTGVLPAPDEFLTFDAERLRGVGLSRQKAASLRDLSERVCNGSLALASLDALPDEHVITSLTQVKGIGRWSAEMFLIFKLRRPDVLPLGDLGLLRAAQKAYGLRKPPSPERFTTIGEPWRPYRSIGCWYLWASLDNGAFG